MSPVWKTSFLKQVMLVKGGAFTGRHGDLCCWIHPSAQTHTHHGNETPVRTAGVLSPAANITLRYQQAHRISCAPNNSAYTSCWPACPHSAAPPRSPGTRWPQSPCTVRKTNPTSQSWGRHQKDARHKSAGLQMSPRWRKRVTNYCSLLLGPGPSRAGYWV